MPQRVAGRQAEDHVGAGGARQRRRAAGSGSCHEPQDAVLTVRHHHRARCRRLRGRRRTLRSRLRHPTGLYFTY